jgi:hypothetical protein
MHAHSFNSFVIARPLSRPSMHPQASREERNLTRSRGGAESGEQLGTVNSEVGFRVRIDTNGRQAATLERRVDCSLRVSESLRAIWSGMRR